MRYEMEELVPIVGKLAEKYTSHESTSVTYEKAEQLMGAVLYCIHEAELGKTKEEESISEKDGQKALVSFCDEMSALQAYETGAAWVREKTEKTLKLYNQLLPEFDCYGSICLYNTMVKELPEFFRRYDMWFKPQDTVVALDYPVLKDLSEYTGIDKIYEFLMCIVREQKALSALPREYVIRMLSRHNENYRDGVENIFGIVFSEKMAVKPGT